MTYREEILEMIWQGKRFLCEEDCTCHTECPKATEYVKEVDRVLSIDTTCNSCKERKEINTPAKNAVLKKDFKFTTRNTNQGNLGRQKTDI